ncbi:sulfatase [Paenibacillus radicis (ex Xue et al. 2023)]|uniref:Sulfatase n=1 Tax=Paenibacillus radicis (ex Xue et al. 2023) TaxID=2972489 RepID=A0ABT1YJ31_9BACL|nr:sulfatase [Paenibacillus radicis (ex Xue et al. 2023)]MCR8633181.1 sulfatase [Paenibacillus radicis (ex Xue et al. 2023)]
MKTIVLLLDSVNRHFLSTYGASGISTPNLDRLAERSVVFTNHWSGSLPCMPARRDMLTGRLGFLERNWGPIEPFDQTLPQMLRDNGIFSHISTDHYHYFKVGGENYCQQFDTWDFIRGQESDPWVSRVMKDEQPEGHLGKFVPQYALNRKEFRKEEDYSSPKTIKSAIRWLDSNHDASDFLLWVEAFDPHEPFDLPESYIEEYEDDYNGPSYYWPEYGQVNVPNGALKHIRKRYAALLTMTDRWVGKLFETMDRYAMWEDTMVIFTSDHGYMLGEHNFLAKNVMPAFNEIAHIPLMIHMPGDKYAGKRVDTLTQNIDLFPTLLEQFGLDVSRCRNRLHGKSLLPLIRGEVSSIRDCALYGYFGKNVNVTDGEYTYYRASYHDDNSPISLYTAMPTTIGHYYGMDHIIEPSRIEMGPFLKWTDFPVYKIPGNNVRMKDQTQSFHVNSEYIRQHLLFNIREDYSQNHPLHHEETEQRMIQLLRKALEEHDSPNEQYSRLGLV